MFVSFTCVNGVFGGLNEVVMEKEDKTGLVEEGDFFQFLTNIALHHSSVKM